METFIATRKMTLRPNGGDDFASAQPIWVSIGPVESFDPASTVKKFRCVVTTGPSPLVPNELYASDPISVLIAALGAVESFCQMLSCMGELTLECGRKYDPDVDSVRSLSKRLWEPGFIPPFLDRGN
jgi:hypothetical protein